MSAHPPQQRGPHASQRRAQETARHATRFQDQVQITYVTHLTEDGVDRRFIQESVGHRCDTSTAIYTHVSGDFMNTALRKALAPALGVAPALGDPGGQRKEP